MVTINRIMASSNLVAASFVAFLFRLSPNRLIECENINILSAEYRRWVKKCSCGVARTSEKSTELVQTGQTKKRPYIGWKFVRTSRS